MTPETTLAANNFAELCRRLLDLAVDFLGADDLESYISTGVPAWDLDRCGQLVLYPAIVSPGYPGVGQGSRPDPSPNIGRTYYLTLELARCVPTSPDGSSSPSTAALDAAGVQALKDYRALDLFVASIGPNSKIRDQLLRSYGLQAISPSQVLNVQPSGGMAAVRVVFSVVT